MDGQYNVRNRAPSSNLKELGFLHLAHMNGVGSSYYFSRDNGEDPTID